jgi:predicted naringenin-chalcone synthase
MSTPSVQALRKKEVHLSTPSVLSLATGNPAQQMAQSELLEMLMPYISRPRYAQAIFKASGIDSRAFVAEPSFYRDVFSMDKVPGTQARNEYYMAEAMPLGEATIQRCLDTPASGGVVNDFFVVRAPASTSPVSIFASPARWACVPTCAGPPC